jgi:hypothetical protein
MRPSLPRPPSTRRLAATRTRATPGDGAAAVPPPPSLGGRVKRFFLGDGRDTKASLQKLGTGAVASYGAISNITYGGGMAVAWIAFVKTKAVSPLADWKGFLAYFAAFWMSQHLVRPLRFTLAVALAPAFDRFIDRIAARCGVSRPAAFGVYIALLGTVTSVVVFGSIFLFCGPAGYAR